MVGLDSERQVGPHIERQVVGLDNEKQAVLRPSVCFYQAAVKKKKQLAYRHH